jgi:alkylation response protein AidB-like acyl-CoA dehydrogenase
MTETSLEGTVTTIDEKNELRSTARKFFEKHSSQAAVRSAMQSVDGFDRALWRAMANELGLQGLAIPEEFGGAGFSFSDLQIVLEEMGRALVCAPFLASAVLAARVLIASGDASACQEYLPGIADGTVIATLAFTDRRGRWSPDSSEVSAELGDDGYTLTGTRHFVLDGSTADVVFAPAMTGTGVSLFAVTPDDGVDITALETLDMTRRQANLIFEHAPAQLVGGVGEAIAAIEAALSAGLAALAAEQVGGARRAMEMSVEYAKIREQFGRPIGSFQAIKHKCADMLLEVESSTSAAYAAGAAIDENSSETALLASLAKSYCSEAFFHVAAETIQVHGGIGFTWEHPAHLYFRRAKASEMLFGNPVHHRERILQELGL